MLSNEELRRVVKGFFCNLHWEEFGWQPKLDGLNFRTLDEKSQDSLEREFTKEKIFLRDLCNVTKINPLD